MSDNTTSTKPAKKTAGAFDIRNIIGSLLGLYGVILLLAGLFADKALDKTGGVNANLWTGIVLIVVSALFLGWARVKPIVVPDEVEKVGDDPTRPAPRRRSGGH
ncbi:hypothetical protein ASD62_09275 [Phycicoccus sp. Root563]|uniref:hypothetical protein n=1 Tax=Phycicoccus sp. Root563 TaxID=1736562 RepID=UPI0007032728|nr:hypothetical protein [Phycicoccus sp. Root563]KQZ89466.1 hypothetical protein ASD62_09275 [Phycicoccus sp. Root563]